MCFKPVFDITSIRFNAGCTEFFSFKLWQSHRSKQVEFYQLLTFTDYIDLKEIKEMGRIS